MRHAVCHNAGSIPFLPPSWASDGMEPALLELAEFEISLITEIERLSVKQEYLHPPS